MLALGTMGRGGLPGILVGNTAEQMLHEAPCSLLAVKPDNFQAPVLPDLPSKRKSAPYM
jgi:universal stress protein E